MQRFQSTSLQTDEDEPDGNGANAGVSLGHGAGVDTVDASDGEGEANADANTDANTDASTNVAAEADGDGDVAVAVDILDTSIEQAATKPARGGGRLLALDLMRGLIMMIMAWDHTKDILNSAKTGPKHPGGESWSGPFSSYDNDWSYFIARAVSNVCAPGFFFTMGISMTLFSVSRREQQWTWGRILHHFFVRGLVLLVVGRLVDAPFMISTTVEIIKGNNVTTWRRTYTPDEVGSVLLDCVVGIFEVMTGLGLTMMLAAPLVLLPLSWLDLRTRAHDDETVAADAETSADATTSTSTLREPLIAEAAVAPAKQRSSVFRPATAEVVSYFLFLSIFAISDAYIVHAQGDDFYLSEPAGVLAFPDGEFKPTTFMQTLARFIIVPGNLPGIFGRAAYPVVPWIGLTSLGIGVGFSLRRHTAATIGRIGLMSVVFLSLFVLVRCFGGAAGNLRGLPRGDGQRAPGLEAQHVDKPLAFFIMAKYPPSLAFALLYVGIDLAFIFAFFKATAVFPVDPTSGRTAAHRAALKAAQFMWDSFLIFGQVPLFFYVCHFWLLGVLSGIAAIFTDDPKVYIQVCVPIWIAVLAVLRPLCFRYGAFKRTTPRNSFWRYI